METHYTAYTKTINGTRFYFVKRYQIFPEYRHLPPVLETYGMHTDFKKACHIALLYDKEMQQQLLNKIENKAALSKVIPMHHTETKIYNLRKRHIVFPSLLKLIGLG